MRVLEWSTRMNMVANQDAISFLRNGLLDMVTTMLLMHGPKQQQIMPGFCVIELPELCQRIPELELDEPLLNRNAYFKYRLFSRVRSICTIELRWILCHSLTLPTVVIGIQRAKSKLQWFRSSGPFPMILKSTVLLDFLIEIQAIVVISRGFRIHRRAGVNARDEC